MKTVTPYLLFNGNAEEAFIFYQSVFGGELEITRFGDMGDGGDMPDEVKSKVANVVLPLAGDTQVLMASDAPPGQEVTITDNPSSAVTLDVDSEEEAERLFTALSAGGQVIMPLAKTEWAEQFGMCTDKYSVLWMVNFSEES